MLVLEKLEYSLATKMKDHCFSLMDMLLIIDQALGLLQQIHEAGFIHRDVKPENFMFRKQIKAIGGEVDQVRAGYQPEDQRQEVCLIDFGLATTYLDRKGRHIPQSKS